MIEGKDWGVVYTILVFIKISSQMAAPYGNDPFAAGINIIL
ncbi:MAG: hypothetical protein R6W90_13625 [Ignavibacteriaceae bacterium]